MGLDACLCILSQLSFVLGQPLSEEVGRCCVEGVVRIICWRVCVRCFGLRRLLWRSLAVLCRSLLALPALRLLRLWRAAYGTQTSADNTLLQSQLMQHSMLLRTD